VGIGLVLLALAACGGESGPTAGDLLVSYFQSGPEPGAILLTISGGAVDKVTALAGQQVSYASPTAGTTKAIVTGTFANGDLLRLHVPDVSLATSYTVRVEQVADQVTFALLNPAEYTFTVHKSRG
jgi:hypothetical protein